MAGTAVRRRLTWQVATVASVTRETASVRTLGLQLPDWPGHRAGCHLDVRLTAEDGYQAEREYSIASAPGEPRAWKCRLPGSCWSGRGRKGVPGRAGRAAGGVTRTVLQAALDAEMADHLGYEKGERPPVPAGNHRNGTSPKTVLTEVGPVPLDIRRDRNGTFEPQIVPKHGRRVEGFNQPSSACMRKA